MSRRVASTSPCTSSGCGRTRYQIERTATAATTTPTITEGRRPETGGDFLAASWSATIGSRGGEGAAPCLASGGGISIARFPKLVAGHSPGDEQIAGRPSCTGALVCHDAKGQEDAKKETRAPLREARCAVHWHCYALIKGADYPERPSIDGLALLRLHASIHRSSNGVGLRPTRVSGQTLSSIASDPRDFAVPREKRWIFARGTKSPIVRRLTRHCCSTKRRSRRPGASSRRLGMARARSCARHRPAHRYSGYQGGWVRTLQTSSSKVRIRSKLLAIREVKAEPPRSPIWIRCQFFAMFSMNLAHCSLPRHRGG